MGRLPKNKSGEEYGVEYNEILYVNNDKYSRAKASVGVNASAKELLAAYLKLAGLARDAKGNTIAWESYKELEVEIAAEKAEAAKKANKDK